MLQAGHLRVFRIKGVDVRVHWSFAITAVTALAVPRMWLLYVLLIVAHELGHAFAVWRYRGRVTSIDLWALGGFCRHHGDYSAWQRSVIAWGGLLVQALLFAVSFALVAASPVPKSAAVQELANVMLGLNLMTFLLNVVPLEPLDGATAWRIVPLAVARLRRMRKKRGLPPSEQALADAISRRQKEAARYDVQ